MWKLTLGYAISKWNCAIWVHSSTFTSTLLLQGVGMAPASLCTHYTPRSKRKTTPSLHNGRVFHHHTIVPELNSCTNYQVSTLGNKVHHIAI
jgi:hypothetical protein